jgi:ribosome recycling factor
MDSTFTQQLTDIRVWLEREFSTIRTGRATPTLLDSVRVEAYGSMMPLNQVGSLGVEDARTLRLSLWDTTLVASVERAVRDADLGVSVISDSAGIRIVFPELTGERRQQLKKLAKSKLEEARIAVRGARDDAQKDVERRFKEGEMGEDEKFSEKQKIQERVDATNRALEVLFDQKEGELDQ